MWSALLLASLVSVVANAQEGFTRQSFLPPEHGVDLTGMPARPMMVGLDVSTNTNNVPFHFPLHVYIGITDRLALGPIHEIGPFYPYGGLCPNCDHVYDDIGRAVRAIARGYRQAYEAATGTGAKPAGAVKKRAAKP